MSVPLRPDALVVGAGPAGLAVTLALRCHTGQRPVVVDPEGRWLAAWHRRFAFQDIEVLRSPGVHHPHPDPFALLASGHEGLVRSGGTSLPTTARFAAFCDDLIDEAGLREAVVARSVRGLWLGPGGSPTVLLGDGRTLHPRRVVLATNARHPVIPEPFSTCLGDERVRLGEHVDVRRVPPWAHVAVVGGGLSAAHLAVGAARRGATVTLISRRALRVRRFDVHPTWIGPKKLRPFQREPDPDVRRRQIDTARGGGSIPARMRRALETCEQAGSLQLCERVEVSDVDEGDLRLGLGLNDGTVVRADEVWLATGGRLDVTRDRLCASLIAADTTSLHGGLPELDEDLRWPGTDVHLTGFAAALRLGPTAGNLIGHRRAALRITAGLCGEDPVRADRVRTGSAACPQADGHGEVTGVRAR